MIILVLRNIYKGYIHCIYSSERDKEVHWGFIPGVFYFSWIISKGDESRIHEGGNPSGAGGRKNEA